MSFLSEWLDAVPPALLYLLAFVGAFGESAPAIGLIVPGQTVIFAAGFVAAEGLVDPVLVGGLVAIGGFLGDCTGYIVGRRWGAAPLRALPARLRPGVKGRARLERLYADHGVKAVILARFQPIGRAFGPYFAGLSGMGPMRFLVAAAVASIAAAIGLVGLGYLAGLGFERLSHTIGVAAVTVVTVLLVVVVIVGLRVKHKHDEQAGDQATP